MKQITITTKAITPIFVGGANQKTVGNLSKAVKSQMAFWWRAIQKFENAIELRNKEFKLFGGLSNNNTQCSSFYINATCITPNPDYINFNGYTTKDKFSRVRNISDVNLLGYSGFGKIQREGNQFTFLAPNSKIEVIITSAPQVDNTEEINNALNLMFCFGGIGGKKLNGWGKIYPSEPKAHVNIEMLYKSIHEKSINELQEYPAFSKYAKLFKTKLTHKESLKVLADLANIYRKSRVGSNLPDAKEKGVDSTSDIITNNMYTGRHSIERRKFIARPVNQTRLNGDGVDRLPKSFHFSVIPEIENGETVYRGYILYMPWKAFEATEDQKKYIEANQQLIGLMKEYGLDKNEIA